MRRRHKAHACSSRERGESQDPVLSANLLEDSAPEMACACFNSGELKHQRLTRDFTKQ
jgi:hypothetical protein